jgi:hypothetical protein
MSPGRKTLGWLALGVALGVAVWVFSPWLTGKAEPWDADAPVWSLSWLVVAVLGGLSGHVRGACLPLGYALGQMLVTIQSVFIGQFGALGWMFIGAHAAAAVLLALALAGMTAMIKRLWRTRDAKFDGA